MRSSRPQRGVRPWPGAPHRWPPGRCPAAPASRSCARATPSTAPPGSHAALQAPPPASRPAAATPAPSDAAARSPSAPGRARPSGDATSPEPCAERRPTPPATSPRRLGPALQSDLQALLHRLGPLQRIPQPPNLVRQRHEAQELGSQPFDLVERRQILHGYHYRPGGAAFGPVGRQLAADEGEDAAREDGRGGRRLSTISLASRLIDTGGRLFASKTTTPTGEVSTKAARSARACRSSPCVRALATRALSMQNSWLRSPNLPWTGTGFEMTVVRPPARVKGVRLDVSALVLPVLDSDSCPVATRIQLVIGGDAVVLAAEHFSLLTWTRSGSVRRVLTSVNRGPRPPIPTWLLVLAILEDGEAWLSLQNNV